MEPAAAGVTPQPWPPMFLRRRYFAAAPAAERAATLGSPDPLPLGIPFSPATRYAGAKPVLPADRNAVWLWRLELEWWFLRVRSIPDSAIPIWDGSLACPESRNMLDSSHRTAMFHAIRCRIHKDLPVHV